MTSSLDDSNSRHVLDALAHRFGWHDRATQHTVTGHQAEAPTRGVTPAAEPLPTFEELRGRTYKLLGDAANWLRTDFERGTGPCREALDAIHRADLAIGAAKVALNEAAALETRRAQRVPEA